MCCWLSQRITYSRDTKHTRQGFSHCSIYNPWREEEEGLQMEESLSVNNNNLIQDLHSSVMIGQISL